MKEEKEKILEYCYKYRDEFIRDLNECGEEGEEMFECLIILVNEGHVNFKNLKDYGMDY